MRPARRQPRHLRRGVPLDKPTKGKVFIDEVDIAQLDAYELAWLRCRKIGYIFQTFNLIPAMTCLENVTLSMVFAGMDSDDARDKGAELLKMVGLGDRLKSRPATSTSRPARRTSSCCASCSKTGA